MPRANDLQTERIRRERVTLRNDEPRSPPPKATRSYLTPPAGLRRAGTLLLARNRKRNAWRGVAQRRPQQRRQVSSAAAEDVRGPRVRPHLVPRAAKRRADTPPRASDCAFLPRLRPPLTDEPTRGRREHGRAAAAGDVPGSRPEHAAGKKERETRRRVEIDTRRLERSLNKRNRLREAGEEVSWILLGSFLDSPRIFSFTWKDTRD